MALSVSAGHTQQGRCASQISNHGKLAQLHTFIHNVIMSRGLQMHSEMLINQVSIRAESKPKK